MKTLMLTLAVVVISALGLACAPAARPSPARPAPTPTTPAAPPATTEPVTDQQEAVNLARTDLAARLGMVQANVTLAKAEAVEWPDTSLGVPEPDKMYAPVITPGFRIVLSAGGKQFEYHAAKLGGKMKVVAAFKSETGATPTKM